MITVIIADDDLNCSKNILNSIEKLDTDIQVVGLASNGDETIKMVKNLQPDLLILDLKMPIKTGIDVLDELKKHKEYKTNIILISGEQELLSTVQLMKYKNITSIITKPFSVVTLHNVIKSLNFQRITTKSSIEKLLNEFSFNFSSKSYLHLIKCIEKATHKPLVLQNLYQEIANEENTSLNNIKWGIEKLIYAMVRYTPKNTLKNYFPHSSNISPKLFIYTIIHILEENNNFPGY